MQVIAVSILYHFIKLWQFNRIRRKPLSLLSVWFRSKWHGHTKVHDMCRDEQEGQLSGIWHCCLFLAQQTRSKAPQGTWSFICTNEHAEFTFIHTHTISYLRIGTVTHLQKWQFMPNTVNPTVCTKSRCKAKRISLDIFSIPYMSQTELALSSQEMNNEMKDN